MSSNPICNYNEIQIPNQKLKEAKIQAPRKWFSTKKNIHTQAIVKLFEIFYIQIRILDRKTAKV